MLPSAQTPPRCPEGAGVWVSRLGQSRLTRLDPATGQAVLDLEAGAAPLALAGGRDALWLACGHIVQRVDPAHNQIVATLRA